MLQKRPQRGALLAREIVYLLVRRDAGALHRRGNELLRQKLAERVAKIAVRVLLKIRQQALIELLLVERRLEVKLQPIALLSKCRICAEDESTSGPDTPKCVKSSSPKSV